MANISYQCNSCGYKSSSWYGKCPECQAWESLEKVSQESRSTRAVEKATIIPLTSIKSQTNNRKPTGFFEFDRVLGGGFMPGEIVLLSGEPGVGKSTLLLSGLQKLNVFYVSGEESAEQIKHRSERLKIDAKKFYFSSNTDIDSIIHTVKTDKLNFDVIVIDSIQMMYTRDIPGIPGGAIQIKEVTLRLIEFAKTIQIPVLLIGHITKDGAIAGPKTLEHMVDCVLYLEGERFSAYRILRSSKNRFGGIDEIGLFEMNENGLIEVEDPTKYLKKENESNTIGKAIVGVTEGSRSLFLEVESLVVPTYLPSPRRVIQGLDYNRVLLLLAVMQKNLKLPLDKFDIYVNIAGGISTKSTGCDLGICASIYSSFKNIPLHTKAVFTGEVSLLGTIRASYKQEKLIKDALRYAFTPVFCTNTITHISQLISYLK